MISEDHLSQIAEDICQSLFDGAPDEARIPPPSEEPMRTLTAVVDISGDWNGSVAVSCKRSTAVMIASVMFDAPPADLSSSDVIDALGEFANMTGGSVKGMLEGEKTLGLPTVGEGHDFVMVVPHTTKVAEFDYHVANGNVLRLAVHQLT